MRLVKVSDVGVHIHQNRNIESSPLQNFWKIFTTFQFVKFRGFNKKNIRKVVPKSKRVFESNKV
jgi:hypothetical protein